MSKKTKSQSKKLKSFKGFFDGLEGYTKVLMPYLLVFAIAFAPFGPRSCLSIFIFYKCSRLFSFIFIMER